MKILITTVLILFCVRAYSQNLDSFFGVKFGSPQEAVKKVMLSKPGCKLDTKDSDDNTLVFSGVKFAGRETFLIVFNFVNNKFHTAKVLIPSSLPSKAILLYNEIKSELNEKYYLTLDDFENYEYPYEKGDGYTESAIKLGKATFTAFWVFSNTNSTEDKNSISLQVTETLDILLTYQDGALIKEAVQKRKDQDFKDY